MSSGPAIPKLILRPNSDQVGLDPADGRQSPVATTHEMPINRSEENLPEPRVHSEPDTLPSQASLSELRPRTIADGLRETNTALRETMDQIDERYQKLTSDIVSLCQKWSIMGSSDDGFDDIKKLVVEHQAVGSPPQSTAKHNILLVRAALFDEIPHSPDHVIAFESLALGRLLEIERKIDFLESRDEFKEGTLRGLIEDVQSFLSTASHDLKKSNEKVDRMRDLGKRHDTVLEDILRTVKEASLRQESQGASCKLTDSAPQIQGWNHHVIWKGVATRMVEFTFGIIVLSLLISLLGSVVNWWNGP